MLLLPMQTVSAKLNLPIKSSTNTNQPTIQASNQAIKQARKQASKQARNQANQTNQIPPPLAHLSGVTPQLVLRARSRHHPHNSGALGVQIDVPARVPQKIPSVPSESGDGGEGRGGVHIYCLPFVICPSTPRTSFRTEHRSHPFSRGTTSNI